MTSSDWSARYIAAELAAHGAVRPPWAYADEHPVSMFWRMGGGESHLMAFWEWWDLQQSSEAERLAFVRAWTPPVFWWPWSGLLVWPELEPQDDDIDAAERLAVERLASVGIGNVAEWDEANLKLAASFET